jgi:hypothetical protein
MFDFLRLGGFLYPFCGCNLIIITVMDNIEQKNNNYEFVDCLFLFVSLLMIGGYCILIKQT